VNIEDRIRAALAARAARVSAARDGWADIERRLDAGVPDEHPTAEAPRPARRFAIGALAFAVFAAAGVFTWNAFRGTPGREGPVAIGGTYPSPPSSGYYILFPDQPEPVPNSNDGAVKIVALTNLPDGTLYSVDTSESGSCCPDVKDGQIVLHESNNSCYGLVGAIGNSPGLSVTITTAPDIGQGVRPGPMVPGDGGWQPPHQPDSVLQILGDHFENLSGDQVVEKDGEKELVANATYSWPEPQCGPDPLPLFGGPTCDPSQFDNQLQGDTLPDAMTDLMGALTQARMCEFWSVDLPPDVEAQHPWPEFAAQWRDWFLHPPKDFSDAQSNAGWTQEPVTWRVTDRQGDRYFVDVTDHGQAIASLEIDALPDFCRSCGNNVVPFWGLVAWTLH
jgi:hypothetical protein